MGQEKFCLEFGGPGKALGFSGPQTWPVAAIPVDGSLCSAGLVFPDEMNGGED